MMNNKKAKQMYRAMLLLLGAFALLWVIGTVNVLVLLLRRTVFQAVLTDTYCDNWFFPQSV